MLILETLKIITARTLFVQKVHISPKIINHHKEVEDEGGRKSRVMLKILECGGLIVQANASEWSRLIFLMMVYKLLRYRHNSFDG